MTTPTTPARTAPPDWHASSEERDAILEQRHTDPHHVLGVHHCTGTRDLAAVVRTYRPDATGVQVVVDDQVVGEGVETAPGFFEVPLKDAPAANAYRLRVAYDDGLTLDLRDPYAFLPTLGEIDLHLAGEGRHEELWRRMGAHILTLDGVRGIAFAVWAPNAKAVRVVGDFNSWDRRLHPLRALGGPTGPGIWEVFIPEIGSGQHYKFELVGADGRARTKADPYAQWTELSPGTASRTFTSQHRWADQPWIQERDQRDALREPMSIYEVHLGSWRFGPDGAAALLPRAGRGAGRLRHRAGLHPRRAAPGRGAPLRGLLGLPGHRLLRPDQPLRQPRRLPRVRRAPPQRRHRRARRLGARALPEGRVGAGALRRHRRCTSTPTPARASTPTGARWSSTSGATRCATSSSPTRCSGWRSCTSTGCASTRSRRCSTSTTRGRQGSGSPTATAGGRTSRPSSSSRRPTRSSTPAPRARSRSPRSPRPGRA